MEPAKTLFPSDYQIDELDKKILMLLQRGIPFCSRPYQAMTEEIGGVTEDEVLRRIAVLKEQHIRHVRKSA